MKMKKTLLILTFSLFGVTSTIAQDVKGQSPTNYTRCSSTEYEQELRSRNPNRKSTEDFEKWIAPFVSEINKQRLSNASAKNPSNSVIKIPVVIHIIHNGDALGTGENISDAQALSQITVLNQDFRRMTGTPGFNNTAVGADMEIEFVMAKRNPTGLATTGIDRVNTGVVQYTSRTTVETMKQATIWDSSRYLNMWTIRIGGGTAQWNGTLGYAQFPSYSGIAGIGYNTPATEAATDGLVMRHDAFGSRDIAPSGIFGTTLYDKGRTATHELGHWAGLRHIWGDGDCTVDDYCNDTPNAGAANYSCAAIDSCPGSTGTDMIENYMDYTNDTCMNIFTVDQKNRMTAVFQNAVRRNTLLYSDALVPVGLALEAGINFDKEGIDNCTVSVGPSVRLKNYGITTITSAQITYSLDGVNPQIYNYTGSLATGASVVVTLPSLAFTSAFQSFYANLTSVNSSSSDGFADNNNLQRKLARPVPTTSNSLTFNLQLDYYGSETSWELKNSAATVLYSGNNYPDVPSPTSTTPLPAVVTIPFNLSSNDCYTLTVSDSYGDGLGFGGYYEIVDPSGNYIARGGSFQTSYTNKFATTALALGVSDFAFADFSLYPNPNNGNFTLKLISESSNEIKLNVNDMSGRQVFENTYSNNGTFNQNINLDKIHAGVYLVSISDGTKKTVQRIIKE
jgi:hypothetical protein